jgi:hypothetical protein
MRARDKARIAKAAKALPKLDAPPTPSELTSAWEEVSDSLTEFESSAAAVALSGGSGPIDMTLAPIQHEEAKARLIAAIRAYGAAAASDVASTAASVL